MTTKTKIFNLALGHLLLQRQITEADGDVQTNESRVLNTFWDTAFSITLKEVNATTTTEDQSLELVKEFTDGPWLYAYKYPVNCAFLRRIKSGFVKDTRSTHIPKEVRILDGVKVILTNQCEAWCEIVPSDFPLETLDETIALAVSYHLAYLASPLIVGKGSRNLRNDIMQNYLMYKELARNVSLLENEIIYDERIESEFLAARMS